MISSIIKPLIIGAILIAVAVFARAELLNYWDHKISKDAIDFKVPVSLLNPAKSKSTASSTSSTSSSSNTQAVNNPCSTNSMNQLILVSISQRHLWACSYTTSVYDSPVITGMDFLAADLTPTGTYHIYSKQRDVHLIGQDSTGKWNDFVYYWMPFLQNGYGIYGFHDATWRPTSDFGNVSPDSNNASHGCVETPLSTSAWLYNWSQVGTTVAIES